MAKGRVNVESRATFLQPIRGNDGRTLSSSCPIITWSIRIVSLCHGHVVQSARRHQSEHYAFQQSILTMRYHKCVASHLPDQYHRPRCHGPGRTFWLSNGGRIGAPALACSLHGPNYCPGLWWCHQQLDCPGQLHIHSARSCQPNVGSSHPPHDSLIPFSSCERSPS